MLVMPSYRNVWNPVEHFESNCMAVLHCKMVNNMMNLYLSGHPAKTIRTASCQVKCKKNWPSLACSWDSKRLRKRRLEFQCLKAEAIRSKNSQLNQNSFTEYFLCRRVSTCIWHWVWKWSSLKIIHKDQKFYTFFIESSCWAGQNLHFDRLIFGG